MARFRLAWTKDGRWPCRQQTARTRSSAARCVSLLRSSSQVLDPERTGSPDIARIAGRCAPRPGQVLPRFRWTCAGGAGGGPLDRSRRNACVARAQRGGQVDHARHAARPHRARRRRGLDLRSRPPRGDRRRREGLLRRPPSACVLSPCWRCGRRRFSRGGWSSDGAARHSSATTWASLCSSVSDRDVDHGVYRTDRTCALSDRGGHALPSPAFDRLRRPVSAQARGAAYRRPRG